MTTAVPNQKSTLNFSATTRAFLKQYAELDTSLLSGENYPAVIRLFSEYLDHIGFEIQLVPMPKSATSLPLRTHLIARKFSSKSLPTLVMYNHVDVVPATYADAFRLKLTSDKMYFRGACDHKGSTVAVLSALEKLTNLPLRFNVIFIATTDEETDQVEQLRYLTKKLKLPPHSLVFDPDTYAGGVSVADLGLAQLEVTVEGKAAHSGASHFGINAIEQASTIIEYLKKTEKVRLEKQISKFKSFPSTKIKFIQSRCNINLISGGIAPNIIPDHCSFAVDLRFIPEIDVKTEHAAINSRLKAFCRQQKIKAEITTKALYESYASEHPEIRVLNQIYKKISNESGIYGVLGSTPAAQWCKELGVPHFGLGVARGDTRMHGVNEFAYLKDVFQLEQTMIEYLKGTQPE